MKPWHALAPFLGLCLLAGVGHAAGLGATVSTTKVTAGTMEDSIVATATLVPIDGVADVHSRIDGRVSKVLVREGDRVEMGQVLAELETDEYTTTVDRLEAQKQSEVAAANAELRSAQRAYSAAADRVKRAQKLAASGAESKTVLEDASSARDIAAEDLARARARRELATGGKPNKGAAVGDVGIDGARRRLEWTKIVAPRAGTVLARRVDPGDVISATVRSGPALFEIADPTHVEVLVEIEEGDAARIAGGLSASIVVPGSRADVARGTITRIGSALHKRTIGTQDARLRSEGTVRSAWIGLSDDAVPSLPLFSRVEAIVKAPPRPTKARVPRGAVAVHDGQATVLLAYGPVTHRRPVLLGNADDAWVEVRNLAPGTVVATRNQ